MELKTTSKHESPSHLVFRLFHCCAANATSSRSLTCIYDQESMSLEPLSSAILHRERGNKLFRKRSLRLFAHFFKFFITVRIPFRRTCAEGHRLQRKLCQADCHLHPIVVVKEPQVTYDLFSQIISYLLHMLIYVGMILLDNLL
jgi:hypothetical protein